jgi:hypothetical protein
MKQNVYQIVKNSCETCVYCDGESSICWYPKSDAVLEALNINPCYEGVLRFMVKEAEEQSQNENEYIDEETAAMINAPECVQREILDNNETILILSDILLDLIDTDRKPPEFIVQAIRELHEHTENTVIPLYQFLVGDIETL